MKARVLVTPRKEVLDPQGAAVLHALGHLGLGTAGIVRVGRVVDVDFPGVDGDTVPTELHEGMLTACQELLANPVVEDYELTWMYSDPE